MPWSAHHSKNGSQVLGMAIELTCFMGPSTAHVQGQTSRTRGVGLVQTMS